MNNEEEAEAFMRIFELENRELQKMALFAISHVCEVFGLDRDRPTLHIAFTEEHVAHQESDKIVISLGTFLRAKELQSLLPGSAKKSILGGVSLEAWQASALFVFWMVAHETIHFGRCHESAPDLESPLVRRALEYEADCLASLALFRLLKDSKLLGPDPKDEDVLRVTYGVIYWHIRHYFSEQEGGSSQTDTHPSWMVRSTYCFSFLLAFAIVPGETMKNPSPDTKERFNAAVKVLTEVVKEGEDVMFDIEGGEIVEIRGKPFKRSLLDFVQVFGDKSGEAKQCMRDYNKISAELDEIQRFSLKIARPS